MVFALIPLPDKVGPVPVVSGRTTIELATALCADKRLALDVRKPIM